MMDKETQEKIARKILTMPKLDTEDYDKLWPWVQETMRANAQQVIDIMKELGYRRRRVKIELRECKKCKRKTLQAKTKQLIQTGDTTTDYAPVWYCPNCGNTEFI